MSQLSTSGQPIAFTGRHPLVDRITRLRGRVRTVLGVFGVGLCVTSAVAGLFLLMLADYLMPMPAVLRLVLLIAGVVGLGMLIWRELFLPLTTRLTDQFLASRVEKLHKGLSDELMSAIHFIHQNAASTNALAARQIDMAAQKTASIRFEDAVDFRRAGKAVGIAMLTVAIVTIIAITNPASSRIAFSRWLTASPIEWPLTTHVGFDWSAYGGKQPTVIPLGEKFTVRAKVDKGATAQPRVWLAAKTDKVNTPWQLMAYQKEQSTSGVKIYESVIEPDGNSLSIRLQAGDDKDEDGINIRMAPRPVITELQGKISAPTYVKDPHDATKDVPAVIVNLLAQSGRAAQGAKVSITVHATKKFQLNEKGEPDLALVDQSTNLQIPLAMNRVAISDTVAELTFTADKTLQAHMLMHDVDGFENRSSNTVTLEVIPDALPSIVITEPRRSVERAPNGIVELTLQATDDWGFHGLKLRADRFDAKEGDPAAFETELPWSEVVVDNAVGSTTGKSKYTWNLAPLHLEPGVRLSFYGMVQDNYDVNGQQHDWVKSAPLYLQIKSAADIQEAERKALAELADRLRNLKSLQEVTRQQTDSIRKIVTASGNMSAEQRSQLATLTQQETQEAAAANAIQQRADQIADDLRQNQMAEGELGKLAQNVAAGMKDVGQQNMPKAASDLSKAQKPQDQGAQATPQQATQSMASATGQQDQAITTMDDLLKQLAVTGDFEKLREDTTKLLQAQKDLNKQLDQIAPKAGGMSRNALPPDLRSKEDKIIADQKELKEKTADLLERLDKAAQGSASSDPAGSESMQKASEAGKQSDVTGNQGGAAKSLAGDPSSSQPQDQGNQINNASSQQTAAAQGLQAMLDELNKNDLRKLEQLAREIRKLIDEVTKLRDDEDKLNKETIAAKDGPSAVIAKLADRQGTLQQNTIIVQKKAQSTRGAAQAAVFIGDASDSMVAAAGSLYSAKQNDALKPETDAVASLNNALEELKKLQNQVEPDAKNKQLAEFIKQYEEIKKDQITVKATSEEIETRRLASEDKEFERLDLPKMGRLALTQGGLSDRINEMSKDEKLSQYEVVVWMNAQVVEVMDASKKRLEKTQMGAQLSSVQQQSLDRIQLIIDALKEEQMKPSEFASGGGGGGGGGPPPLVPPLAQLKLLKAMQVIVNNGTRTAGEALKTAATDAEKNEYQTEVQTLGNKQGQIQEKADHLMQALRIKPRSQ